VLRRPGEAIEDLLTLEDLAAMEAQIEAEARGDAEQALVHFYEGLFVGGNPLPHQLRELVRLGDDAPGWMYSRWCVGQAYRWMLQRLDPRTDLAVSLVLAATHHEQVESVSEDPVALRELGTRVAASDWLAEQVAVYELGGLADFLAERARPALLARADQVHAWTEAEVSAYRLEPSRGDGLVLHDLRTRQDVEVLNLGAQSGHGPGEHLLGRLVPVSVAPGLMFDSRPVAVDEETARRIAQNPRPGDATSWLAPLAVAREHGRLPYAFSCRGATLLSSDLVPEWPGDDGTEPESPPPAPRAQELIAAGVDLRLAEAVLVAEFAVEVAGDPRLSSCSALVPHLSAVFVDREVVDTVLQHCVRPAQERGWRRLAAATTQPISRRCLEVAEACAGAGP
jgi:hypothetical protein